MSEVPVISLPIAVAKKLCDIQRYLRVSKTRPNWATIANELVAASVDAGLDWEFNLMVDGSGLNFKWPQGGQWMECNITESTLVDRNILHIREVLES